MATYTILGHDQKPYGGVTEAQVRQWIADGRLNAQSQVQIEGATDWKPLSTYPEFADALASRAALPPAPPSNAKNSGLAITSLVMGIVTYVACFTTFLITVPFGLVLGIIALKKIGKSEGQLKGKGMALAGVILNGVALLMIPLFVAMLLPALAAAHNKAGQITCINNEKQLALAIRIYAGDNTNCFPAAASWCDAIQPEVSRNPRVFKCPVVNGTSRCDYAFNEKLSGLNVDKASPETVMIFESDAGWNANGGSELLPTQFRHRGNVVIVGFADGSIHTVPRSELGTLRWDP